MSKQNGVEQFTLTKKPEMNDAQKKIFDIIKGWGRSRHEGLRMMFELLFTEEELENSDSCLFALYARYRAKQHNAPEKVAAPRISPAPSPVKEGPSYGVSIEEDDGNDLSQLPSEQNTYGYDINQDL